MSKDIETCFWQEVRQRRLKKIRRNVLIFTLGLVTIGSIYCLHQGLFLSLTVLCLVELILIIKLFLPEYFQGRLSKYFLLSHHNRSRLKHLPRKYIVGIVVLAIALIVQAYPSLVMTPINSTITRFVYNPQPHTIPSPWPWKSDDNLHPAVVKMPPEAEKSISSVAAYIMQKEDNPWLRTKAIHDYVISRVTYDIDVLKNAGVSGSRPQQDAETVFHTHKAVCEGYARLFGALGKAMGMDIAYVRGNVRRDLAPTEVIPSVLRFTTSDYDWTYHAWNTVKIEGNWYLVDPTWDDTNDESLYRSDYLLIPPEVMIISHFPEQAGWQLLENPASQSAFEEKPILSPQFFSEGLELRFPQKYQTKVQGTATLKVKIPANYGKELIAHFKELKDRFSFLDLATSSQENRQDMQWCQTGKVLQEETQLICQFSNSGDYQVVMFIYDKVIPQPIGQFKFTSTHSPWR